MLAKSLALALLGGASTDAWAVRVMPDEWQVCRDTDQVVIGVVTGRTSRWVDFDMGREIVSDVDFSVELVIHGAPPASFRFSGIGGQVGSTRARWSEGQIYDVGDRLLLLVEVGRSVPEFLPGLVVSVEETVRADLSVLADLDLAARWGERCEPYLYLESGECPQEPAPLECSESGASGGVLAELLHAVRTPPASSQ